MTTDELERDLKTLAEPQADDERLRLAIRAQLGEPRQVRPKAPLPHPSRCSARARLSGRSACGGDRVALIGTGGSGPPPRTRRSLRTWSGRSARRRTSSFTSRSPGCSMTGRRSRPNGGRDEPALRNTADQRNRGSASRPAKGSARWSTSRERRRRHHLLPVRRRHEHDLPAPGLPSPTLIDPIDDRSRGSSRTGQRQVAGTVTIDGQSLYKIELPNGVVGYFDQTDYRPVYLDNPQRDGSVVRTRVITYEELPMTPENEQLLSITAQHPRASVDTNPNKAPSK